MSTYRDDLEAALARNADLEHRVRELEAALQPAAEPSVPAPVPPPVRSSSTDIESLVDARMRTIHSARARHAEHERVARQRRIDKLLRRRARVTIAKDRDRTRITIARKSVRDGLVAQAGWGIGFAAINPGVFVVFGLIGLLWSIGVPGELVAPLAIPLWLVILLAINVVYARVTNRAWHLDLTRTGHFAVHRGNPRTATLFGVTAGLDARLEDQPDPAELHEIRLGDGHEELVIDGLTDRDVRAMHAVLIQTPAKL